MEHAVLARRMSPLRDAWETIEHFGFSVDTAPVLGTRTHSTAPIAPFLSLRLPAHFQAADSVHAGGSPEKVYYLCNRGVACYNLEQRKVPPPPSNTPLLFLGNQLVFGVEGLWAQPQPKSGTGRVDVVAAC
jgi:hypothetical protein